MTNKNLATKNINDFTVLPTGDAYISQRKAAELCGVNKTNIQKYTAKDDTKQGLNYDLLEKSIRYYAFKGNEIAQESYVLIGHH